MNRETKIVIAVVSGASFALGGLGGYFLAEKRLRERYDQRARRDVAEVAEYYKQLYKVDEYESPATAAAVLIPEREQENEFTPPPSPEMDAAVEALESYSPEEPTDEKRLEIQNVFEKARTTVSDWNYELEMARRTPDRPYVITNEEYLANEAEHEQTTLTYFVGDDTLVDSLDEPLLNYDYLLDEDNLMRFGHGSNDNNIVYIRNEKQGIDFEVLRSPDKYTKAILGVDDREDRRQRTPKFRRGDDE